MDYSILVNKENKIKNNYLEKIKLIKTIDCYNKEIYIEELAYNSYLKLKDFLKTKNIEIGIESAYRSIEEQEKIYEEYRRKYGSEYANKYVAPKEYSEHHTALAIDIIIKENGKYQDYNQNKSMDKTFEIIHNYLSEYGFILRYPKDKEEITGYPYESWHIRYVGKFIAKIINDNNLTLEEYKKNYSGVIVINKEKGYTSFDIVNKIRRLFGIKRIGHTGTLDPLAEGVLIICIGKATKIVELLTSEDKEYIAGVELGKKTDTYDIEGKIIEENIVPSNINLNEVLLNYKKTYMQEVPIYSAVKVNGKKLYEYARNSKEVNLPKKKVTIKEIELLSRNNNIFKFKAHVSKGCYIRSLINDIGSYLGCGAIMTSLIRIRQGNVDINIANQMSDIENRNLKIYSIEEVLDYPVINVDKDIEEKIKNGVPLQNGWNIKDKVIFKSKDNNLLGIYEVSDNLLKVWKNFF